MLFYEIGTNSTCQKMSLAAILDFQEATSCIVHSSVLSAVQEDYAYVHSSLFLTSDMK